MASRTLFFVLMAVYGAGQAQNQAPQSAGPAPAKSEAPKAVPNGGDTAAAAAVDPKTYVIGAEDILYIRVFREADFTITVAVRPDGKITEPLLGDLQAAGLTPERLGEQLKQALSEYVNKPDVAVIVLQVNSKKYYVSGEVNRPGEYTMPVPIHVFDALSNAGGFRDFANKKKVTIVRGTQRIKFNYQDVLKGKNLNTNILLENGDTIVVP